MGNRILLCRTDRLGDLVLTTPSISAVKDANAENFVGMLVSDYAAPIVSENSDIDELIIHKRSGENAGFSGWKKLVSRLKSGSWDSAVLFNNDFFVASALMAAGVPMRIGMRSRIYSSFVYTHPVRQKRSQVKMHEAEYGLKLLGPLGINTGEKFYPPKVIAELEARKSAQSFLDESKFDIEKGFIILHPGMGGSALNWPFEHWVCLVSELIQKGEQVIITTHGDLELTRGKEILDKCNSSNSIALFSDRSLAELIGLISECRLIVAPSTGPLHLGSALEKKVIGIYPPIRVQNAKRWGPYVEPKILSKSVISPNVECPEIFNCAGESCVYFNCMESITAKEMISLIEQRLEV